tara:strand:+ start:16069 stop:16968 length:900 start_codon:yes stop_codon:yes gene_type:complete
VSHLHYSATQEKETVMGNHPIVEKILSRTPEIQAMIKKTLKVDAGKQNVHHIAAVAHGFSNYNTLLGLTGKKFYSIRANLGSKSNPFYVEKEVGEFDSEVSAINHAEVILRDCNKNMRWALLANGEETSLNVGSYCTGQRGLNAQIEINADTLEELEQTLEDITHKASKGITVDYKAHGNTTYKYEVVGEDFDRFVSNDIEWVDEEHDTYYVFSEGRKILTTNHIDDATVCFEQSLKDSKAPVIFSKQINLEDAREREDDEYVLYGMSSNVMFVGELDDILDSIGDYKERFQLAAIIRY